MTEWALPVNQQIEYDHVVHELEHDPPLAADQAVLSGRLLAELQGEVSRSERDVRPDDDGQPAVAQPSWSKRPAASCPSTRFDYARQALYRGQCNCPYWHGAFGGIYLPHLRNAIYNQLIACDNLLDQATGKTGRLRRGDGR